MAIISTIPRQIINTGSYLDDPTAETVYTAFNKTNLNFSNVWRLLENQGYEKIFLDLKGIDTTKQELEYISEAIERGKRVSPGVYGDIFSVSPIGRKPLFYTVTPSGVPTIGEPVGSSSVSYIYRFYRVHKKGQDFGGNGGVFIGSSDISPAGSFTINGTENNGSSDIYINLGDIGSSNVWDKFNEGKPSPNLGDPWFIKGLSIVSATQNGVSKKWIFNGNQFLGLEEGYWGGSNITDPNYLSAIEEYFELISDQPTVYPDIFITKTSKKYRDYDLSSSSPIELDLNPEFSTYNLNLLSGSGEIKGFESEDIPASYDGMDIYIKNQGNINVILLHNDSSAQIKFLFKTESDVIVKPDDILHLKYSSELNGVEVVGNLDLPNLPIPFGNLRILKKETNSNNNIIEIGDVVTASMLNNNVFLTFGEYIGGDKMEESSYDELGSYSPTDIIMAMKPDGRLVRTGLTAGDMSSGVALESDNVNDADPNINKFVTQIELDKLDNIAVTEPIDLDFRQDQLIDMANADYVTEINNALDF